MTATTSGPATAGTTRTPWSGLSRLASRARAQDRSSHEPWCVSHGPSGCEGQIFALPGTQLLVWMSAPTAGDPRLVVEGPDGLVQLPVQG